MKKIITALKDYAHETSKPVLAAVSLLTAILIFCNYYFGLDTLINNQQFIWARLFYRYLISVAAFAFPYYLYTRVEQRTYFQKPLFVWLVFIAPLIFSVKMTISTDLPLSGHPDWVKYWNQLIYWPLRVFIVFVPLWLLWKLFFREQSFFGVTIRGFGSKPYFIMLACMLPLIDVASTQPDFLLTYPKLNSLPYTIQHSPNSFLYTLLFELSYGSDFFSIELFFRGFLVLAFTKWAGKDAILAMACFYCTIHFGKPLGECISSYFGGLLLGIVIYSTRSIFGGLIVHVGIAWLMELGGYWGHVLK